MKVLPRQEGFSYDSCCAEHYGLGGNKACWDAMHTFKTCHSETVILLKDELGS